MNSGDAFGDLRDLLHQPPSAENWLLLCVLIDEQSIDDLHDHWLPYTLRYLTSWPDALRRIPQPDWLEQPEHPKLQICRSLDITDRPQAARELLRHNNLALTSLRLDTCDVGQDVLSQLAYLPWLGNLQRLELPNNPLGLDGIEHLCRQTMPHLRWLDLGHPIEPDDESPHPSWRLQESQPELGDELADLLLEAPWLARLKGLHLDGQHIGGERILALIEGLERPVSLSLGRNMIWHNQIMRISAERLAGLRYLALGSRNRLLANMGRSSAGDPRASLTSRDWQHLFSSCEQLQALHVDNTNFNNSALNALVEAPCFAGLRELNLEQTYAGWAPELWDTAPAGELRALNLAFCWLEDDELGALLHSPALRKLESLDVSKTRADLGFVRELLESPLAETLTALNLNYTPSIDHHIPVQDPDGALDALELLEGHRLEQHLVHQPYDAYYDGVLE